MRNEKGLLEMFFHLSCQSFRLGSSIGLWYLSSVLSLRAIAEKGYLKEAYMVPQERVQSENYPKCETFDFSMGGQ